MLQVADSGVQFAVSDRLEKHHAVADWERSGFDVIDIIDVEVSDAGGDSPSAVIRALASTPDGAETLSTLLQAVADSQRPWEKVQPASAHKQ